MHSSTKRRVALLETIVHRQFKTWEERYPGITGVSVSRKERKGNKLPYFSITFHVIRKLDEPPEQERIPPVLMLNLEDGESIRVPTDVVESGEARLTDGTPFIAAPGFKVTVIGGEGFGAFGAVVQRGAVLYLLSVAHVLAAPRLIRFPAAISVPQHNQNLDVAAHLGGASLPIACFAEAIINPMIDAAIARIPDLSFISPRIPMLNAPDGYRTLSIADQQSGRVSVRKNSFTSGIQGGRVVGAAHMRFPSRFGSVQFSNLLKIAPVMTTNGDSGTLLVDDANRAIGMCVGIDSRWTYATPIESILRVLDVSLV